MDVFSFMWGIVFSIIVNALVLKPLELVAMKLEANPWLKNLKNLEAVPVPGKKNREVLLRLRPVNGRK